MSPAELMPLDNPDLVAESTHDFGCSTLLKWYENLHSDYKRAETYAVFDNVDNLPSYTLHFHKNGMGRERGISAFFKTTEPGVSTVHITARQLPGNAINGYVDRDVGTAPITALRWKQRDLHQFDLIKLYVIGRNLPRPQIKTIPIAFVINTETLTIPRAESALASIGRLITATSIQSS